MIDLYTWPTPNGHKAAIMLEESRPRLSCSPGRHRQWRAIRRRVSEAINPNGKIPTIVDQDGPGGGPFAVFESGAILLYLAEKTGRFLSADPRGRSQAIQWLMFQVGGIGPMFGQAQHFRRFAPQPLPYAIERYSKEAARLYGVLDKRLAASEFLAEAEYSIADIASYPWVASAPNGKVSSLSDTRMSAAGSRQSAARPAVQRGMQVPRI